MSESAMQRFGDPEKAKSATNCTNVTNCLCEFVQIRVIRGLEWKFRHHHSEGPQSTSVPMYLPPCLPVTQ